MAMARRQSTEDPRRSYAKCFYENEIMLCNLNFCETELNPGNRNLSGIVTAWVKCSPCVRHQADASLQSWVLSTLLV